MQDNSKCPYCGKDIEIMKNDGGDISFCSSCSENFIRDMLYS